jgi:CHASE2 domain-containing sensor protein
MKLNNRWTWLIVFLIFLSLMFFVSGWFTPLMGLVGLSVGYAMAKN